MRNKEFADAVAEKIRQAQLGAPRLLDYEEDHHFQNAVAVFQVGALELKIVRDRGHEFIEVRRVGGFSDYIDLDALSVVLGWAKPEDIMRATTSGADDPPTGPYWRIEDALARLASEKEKVARALTPPELEETLRRVEGVQRLLASDLF